MKPTRETLKVTWKFIRRKGYPSTRTPSTYCTYVVENEKHKHKMRTYEGSDLFKLLETTRISRIPETSKYSNSIFVDGTYCGDKLISITNPRKR
jgi:hypothetical protein